jgi:sugar phosphate isomerase/epimerase
MSSSPLFSPETPAVILSFAPAASPGAVDPPTGCGSFHGCVALFLSIASTSSPRGCSSCATNLHDADFRCLALASHSASQKKEPPASKTEVCGSLLLPAPARAQRLHESGELISLSGSGATLPEEEQHHSGKPRAEQEDARRFGSCAPTGASSNQRRHIIDSTKAVLDDDFVGVRDIVRRAVIEERNLAAAGDEGVPLVVNRTLVKVTGERASLVRRTSSEYFGVCLDTGNNLSLLDSPAELVRELAPYAVTTHFKDMAVAECSAGFLLSEVPLGTGMLNLPEIVSTISRARPRTHINLEMITRDPLKVPCLTDKYWATFPSRNGLYLARTLTLVRAHKPAQELPEVSALARSQRATVEEENVKQCLAYARGSLGLSART